MDLIAVDIDGTLASNRDQMDKYLTGFFASNRRFFKAIRNATVNVEIADRVREIAADTGAEVVVITGRDGTYMKELNQFIARAGLEPKHVFAKPGNDGSNSPAWKDSVIESLIADGNRIIHAFEDTDHEVYLRRGIPVTRFATTLANGTTSRLTLTRSPGLPSSVRRKPLVSVRSVALRRACSHTRRLRRRNARQTSRHKTRTLT